MPARHHRFLSLRAQVQLLVGTLAVLGLASAVGTVIATRQLDSLQTHLREELRPAQSAVAGLNKALVDEETGERGFLLTGDSALLQPYTNGVTRVAQLEPSLRNLMRGQPTVLLAETRLSQAIRAWTVRIASPQIAQRRRGPLAEAVLVPAVVAGKGLFDEVRTRLDTLASTVDDVVAADLQNRVAHQDRLNALAIGTAAAALLVALLAQLVLRRLLARPLRHLVTQVERVADGDVDHSVEPGGSTGLVRVATAIEAMRMRVLESAADAADVRDHLALVAEDERVARALHDHVIQRLFAIGLSLQATSTRTPAVADALAVAIDDLDDTIRELRAVIFGLALESGGGGLREQVLSLARQSERSLGFAPSVVFAGTIDTAASDAVVAESVPALREILSDIARNADATLAVIDLAVEDGMLVLSVTDNGDGIPPPPSVHAGQGPRNLSERAKRLGGVCTITARPEGGTKIDWRVAVDAVRCEPVAEPARRRS